MRNLVGVATMLALCGQAQGGPALAGPLDGTWTGRYTCMQGETGLELFVTTAPGGMPQALFHFGDGSIARPEGCFAMDGTVVPGGVTFTATHWLQRPYGYVTVNLLGAVNGDGYAGWVAGPACTVFSLTRQAPRAAPAACQETGGAVS